MSGDIEFPENVSVITVLGVPGAVDVDDTSADLARNCRLVNLEDAAVTHPLDSENFTDVSLRETIRRLEYREDE